MNIVGSLLGLSFVFFQGEVLLADRIPDFDCQNSVVRIFLGEQILSDIEEWLDVGVKSDVVDFEIVDGCLESLRFNF